MYSVLIWPHICQLTTMRPRFASMRRKNSSCLARSFVLHRSLFSRFHCRDTEGGKEGRKIYCAIVSISLSLSFLSFSHVSLSLSLHLEGAREEREIGGKGEVQCTLLCRRKEDRWTRIQRGGWKCVLRTCTGQRIESALRIFTRTARLTVVLFLEQTFDNCRVVSRGLFCCCGSSKGYSEEIEGIDP